MRLLEKIARVRCSKCRQRKLLAGPFYDRLTVRCMNCGAKFSLRRKSE